MQTFAAANANQWVTDISRSRLTGMFLKWSFAGFCRRSLSPQEHSKMSFELLKRFRVTHETASCPCRGLGSDSEVVIP